MLVNHEPKASDFKSSPNTPSGLSRRKLSQKSFVGFHMVREISYAAGPLSTSSLAVGRFAAKQGEVDL